ncbi:hypothetical protein AM571_PC02046 (plasmid) [Rhizobium etli 8C-3]|uniref:Uncharacterized protein n=1 Tax=Rhizobium etli 8C-3 TaxID=538025 RepID=A0A1L5PHV6_RHIET|nr:hypothetical protein AM571_PC02046 [Rhizobium etli 8C-3]
MPFCSLYYAFWLNLLIAEFVLAGGERQAFRILLDFALGKLDSETGHPILEQADARRFRVI